MHAVETRGSPQVYTDDAILKAIRRFKRENKRVPRVADLTGEVRPNGYPSAGTLAYRFGSFGAAIEAAGFERPVRGKRSS